MYLLRTLCRGGAHPKEKHDIHTSSRIAAGSSALEEAQRLERLMTYPKNAHKKSPVVKESAKPMIIELLTKKPMTTREIGVLVDRHHESVAKILRDLGEGKCHICGWAGEYAIWTMHPGKHVPRPATPKSIKERVSRKKRSEVDYLNCNYIKAVRLPWELTPVMQA